MQIELQISDLLLPAFLIAFVGFLESEACRSDSSTCVRESDLATETALLMLN